MGLLKEISQRDTLSSNKVFHGFADSNYLMLEKT